MSQPPPLDPSPLEPLRVETLPYQSPMTGPIRPGIIVAVGVMSIIVGCISILVSCAGLKTATTRTQARVIMQATTMPGNNQFQNNADDSPPALKDETRQVAIRGMDRSGVLSPARRAMLDKLLARTGDKMFPFAESNLTEQRVASSISQTGQTPGAGGTTDDYFILANGRVEVGEDHASFSSNTRGEQTINVNSDNAVQQATNPSNQTFNLPTISTVPTKVPRAHTVYGISSGIELFLALYLVFTGIMVLTGSMRGRRLHLAYVLIKFPVLIIGTIAFYFIEDERFGGLALSGGASLGPSMAIVAVAVICLPAFIYPIALLIVMNAKSVKEYYRMEV